ncbi:MAG: hypothetical protein M3R02_25325 [Chloroflexota bacterium]|nr:hypothetical protein [Chloroflexota bacterium]
MSDPLLPPPRYRIEHRRDDEPPLIVAFADTDRALQTTLAVQVMRHVRDLTGGVLVVVEQDTDEIVTVHRLSAT